MLRALVDYGDDSEDERTNNEGHSKARGSDSCSAKRKNDLPRQPSSPTKKARALPALDSSLFTSGTFSLDGTNPEKSTQPQA
ncbi:hypothetical protein FRC11_005733 [Ceratobasidium sp. 423]|nr:hypothetical protein FRC11_005733 [Ceratobasidium sp. 423]